MTSFNIYEAYAAVYNEDLREELLIEETILLESIEDLYDDELEEIVEDSIYSMLDEGYYIDEVEEIFEEVFSEARMDMAARAAKRKADTEASEESAKAARSRGASAVRKEKRAANIDKIKGRIKGAVKTAMTNVRNVVDKPAREYAEKRGVVSSKGGKKPLGAGEGIGSVKFKQRSSEGRREVRGAVVKDLASRAKAKLGRGAEKVRSAGEKATGAVKSSSDAAQGRMRDAGSAVKKGAKGLLGGAARAVSRGARDVARRLGEDVDLYDVVLEHLLDEGFADTEESATVIMANMSEEWREEILDEAKKKFPKDKVDTQAAKHERDYLKRPNSQVGQRSLSNAKIMKAIASTVEAGDDPRSTMHGQDLRKLGKK
jgi:hypothetical protein